jgi:hypothetical protein
MKLYQTEWCPEATQRHQEVRWRKVKGHSKTSGAHKTGNDRADELAVAAKQEAGGERRSGLTPRGIDFPREADRSRALLLEADRSGALLLGVGRGLGALCAF